MRITCMLKVIPVNCLLTFLVPSHTIVNTKKENEKSAFPCKEVFPFREQEYLFSTRVLVIYDEPLCFCRVCLCLCLCKDTETVAKGFS